MLIQSIQSHPGRESANPSGRLTETRTALSATVGAVVVLLLFFLAIGGVDPGDVAAACIVVGLMGVAWMAHSWKRLFGGREDLAERDRRGF